MVDVNAGKSSQSLSVKYIICDLKLHLFRIITYIMISLQNISQTINIL